MYIYIYVYIYTYVYRYAEDHQLLDKPKHTKHFLHCKGHLNYDCIPLCLCCFEFVAEGRKKQTCTRGVPQRLKVFLLFSLSTMGHVDFISSLSLF